MTYAGTAGLLQDSANLTFNGTTLTANTIGAFTLGGTVAGGGNQLNNVIIGTTTPLAGAFTTLSASGVLSNSDILTSSGILDVNGTNVSGTYIKVSNSGTAQSYLGSWLRLIGSGVATDSVVYTNGVKLGLVVAGTVRATATTTGLDVTGTLSATSTLSSGAITSSGNSAFGGATADPWRSAFRAITLQSTGQNLFASTGNTGISSNLYSGVTLSDWTYAATGTGAVYQQAGGGHYFQCAPSGSAGTLATIIDRLIISNTGIVTMSAYGAGAATFSAAGVISSVSDETWKVKDGAPVDTDAMLNKLEPGYWYYNDEKKETFGKDRQLGFYAQNVNAAIGPEAAPEPEEGKPWGYYDRSVLAVTVMSLQKSLATIESLTARITALEAK